MTKDGSVLVFISLIMIGNPSTRKLRLKIKRKPISSPGAIRGTVTRVNVRSKEAPQASEASSNGPAPALMLGLTSGKKRVTEG
jgi:hypothetical protein